jgi:hypothetical protein
VRAASPSTKAQSDASAQTCCATRQKPMDEKLLPDQSGENRSVHPPSGVPGPRHKTNSVGRAKTARPASRFLYSKPPLGGLTKVSLPTQAKPPEGTPQGPVNRGLAAVYFGANSVASALNLPRERDLPKNHLHSKPNLSSYTSKPDISTWQRIGHFYLALTGYIARTSPEVHRPKQAGCSQPWYTLRRAELRVRDEREPGSDLP